MTRKIVAVALLAAFGLFECSCSLGTLDKRAPEPVPKTPAELGGAKASKLRIVSVVLKTGGTVDFKNAPARLSDGRDAVVGMTEQELDLAPDEVKEFRKNERGEVIGLVTGDGRAFRVLAVSSLEGRVRVKAFGPATIPLADIQQLWVSQTSKAGWGAQKTVLVVVAVAFVGAVVLALTHKSPEPAPDPDPLPSCPFVYSFDGEGYVLDAELYGSAISEGLKRTDWVETSSLKPVDGEYRLVLANELDETHYTDELKLVAVDHAPGVRVAPDLEGVFHAFAAPLAPTGAVDQDGRDILPFVGAKDGAFWLSPLDGRDPDDGSGEFRDELVLEFPKPAGAKRAMLLANAWTTSWGSVSSGKFLRFFGESLPDSYAEVDRHGPLRDRFLGWMAAEELYSLKVWVETPGGWKDRAMILGGAPVVAKDKAYALDIADVPGETLRIKLRPPVNFWMIDALAVDYGESPPLRATELAAARAVDQSGRDMRSALARTDGAYLVSPSRGEWTELAFAAPPLAEGLERTLFVKASGFYRAHLDARGVPQTELIERLLGEPGFAARYSLREYLKSGTPYYFPNFLAGER